MAFFRISIQYNYSSMAAIVKIVFFFARSILKSQHTFHEVFIYYTCAMAIIGSVKGYCAKKPSYLLFFFFTYLKTENISWNDLKSIYRCIHWILSNAQTQSQRPFGLYLGCRNVCQSFIHVALAYPPIYFPRMD